MVKRLTLNVSVSMSIMLAWFLMPLFLCVMVISFILCKISFWWIPLIIMIFCLILFGFVFYWFNSKLIIYEDYLEIINMKKTIKISYEEIEYIKVVKNMNLLGNHPKYMIVLKKGNLSIKYRYIDNLLFDVKKLRTKVKVFSSYKL